MGGLCGLVHWDGTPVDPLGVQRMAAAAHRASHGIRVMAEGPVGLAQLQFTSPPEAQPESPPAMRAQDGLVLVADARLDNRNDLRRALADYVTNPDPPDSILLLAAYRRWGADCASHLLGDFAFAIYDGGRHRLFAARDPMAMRPLYYRAEPRRLLFGSEVKQILAAPGVPIDLFEPAVAAHLVGAFGHLEWTFYDGVAQLPPAHALLAGPGGTRIWRWWDIDPGYRISYAGREQYVDHLRELFVEAVRCRMRATTKPVGVFLSGGIDSGSIAATAAWLRKRGGAVPELRMFCWAFECVPECDERHISDQLVKHYDLPVTYVSADASPPLADYPAHGPDRDEPFVGVYQPLIERAVETAHAQGVQLVLSGDRGDLMMGNWIGGYLAAVRTDGWIELWNELRAHRRWSRDTSASILRRFVLRPGWDAVIKRLDRTDTGQRTSYPAWMAPSFAHRVGLDDLVSGGSGLPIPVGGYSRRQRYRAVFMPMHMRGVTWSERTHARFGTGFADPWSDRRIAEFVVAVPQQVIGYPGGPEKLLARQAMSGIMPDQVRRAARKIVPYPLYLRALRDTAVTTIESLLTESQAAARGYIELPELKRHYHAIRAGEREHPCFWWALSLEMWLRAHWAS